MNSGPGWKDRQLARYYDFEYRDYTRDVEFYVQYASMMDPDRERPVLELGCGTGRIMLALAAAGFQVTGVDSSEAMLEACAQKASELGLSDKIRLVTATMQDPGDLGSGSFNLAFCALNTFAYLTSGVDRLRMLRAVHSMLVQHGILILDLTPPFPHLLVPTNGEIVHQGTYRDEETGATVYKLVSGEVHHATQTHLVTVFYDTECSDGSLSRISQQLKFRWMGRYEAGLLLSKAGYRLEKVYGGYELEDFDDESERMIFVART